MNIVFPLFIFVCEAGLVPLAMRVVTNCQCNDMRNVSDDSASFHVEAAIVLPPHTKRLGRKSMLAPGTVSNAGTSSIVFT